MRTHIIQSVKPVRGIVDALNWDVHVSTSFNGPDNDSAFVFRWEGAIGFYKDTSLGTGRLQAVPFGLRAEWTNREHSARVVRPDEATFKFTTTLPGDALDRIERFRDGGRLFARLEGRVFVVHRSSDNGKDGRPWFDDMARLMGDPRRSSCNELLSQFFELTHHVWCADVLAILRPPGRYVFDVQVPAPIVGDDSAAKRAVQRLDEARLAHDRGGLPGEVARSVYRAMEEAKSLMQPFAERYGSYAVARLEEQRKALASMCDPDRHAQRSHHDELEFDRPLALHALASASSILSCLLR